MKYLIGKIINTHGIKGHLIVKSLSDFNRFKKGNEVFVESDSENIKLTINSVRESNKGLIILFEGYNNINDVLKYKGLNLFTNEEPKLLTDEFHYNDLLNKEVYNSKNKFIGKVVEVVPVPQGHLLRIEIEDYTKLVPFNKVFIKEISDIITINEIEGLLWK